jgi:hypothetical protein
VALDVHGGAIPRPSARSPWLRLRAWWRRTALTRELAAGDDPDAGAERALVARGLIGTPAQHQLADALDRVVRAAQQGRRRSGVKAPLNRPDILLAHNELAALAERLRDGGPAPVQGLAIAALLVSDGASPLYDRRAAHSVQRMAQQALDRLDGPIA